MDTLKRPTTLLFKIWKFPRISETFIVNQIILAVKLGYDVKILVEEKCNVNENGYRKVFEKYNVDKKIILHKVEIPKEKFHRIFKLLYLTVKHIQIIKYAWRFLKVKPKNKISSLIEFYSFAKLRDFDVIHIQFGTNKDPLDLLKKIGFFRGKLICSFHGHDIHFPINGIIPEKGYYDTLFKVADVLICNTPFLTEKLINIKAPPNKIATIPAAVNTNYFKPNNQMVDYKRFRLITIGRIDELKGQVYGIKAVEKLLKEGIDLNYIIAGYGPNQEYLENLVKKKGLTNQISFVGKLNQEEVRKHLQEANVFLMTSVTNSSGMQESQGVVTGEAQACGCPVIAFDSGGVKYTLIDGKTGFLCQEKNIDEFANKIKLLLFNKSLRYQMQLNSRHFIEKNFSEKFVIKKWQEMYGLN